MIDPKERRRLTWVAARAAATTPARLAAASYDRLRSVIRSLPDAKQVAAWRRLDDWLSKEAERLDS